MQKMYIKWFIVGIVINLTFAKNCDFHISTVKPFLRKSLHIFRKTKSLTKIVEQFAYLGNLYANAGSFYITRTLSSFNLSLSIKSTMYTVLFFFQ